MDTGSHHGSAKIYAFPARGRVAAEGARTTGSVVAFIGQPQICAVEFGSGWYHDAAMEEAKPKS